MKLSIVIVNYNVEYFLEQCITSALDASKQIDAEIFMVDNASVDGSVQMVKYRFPSVKVIANKDNVGFSRANNQAMRIAAGEYVLLLNPDTVLEENTLQKCIEFMDSRPEAGGLGVKMVDGKGEFLPESKRGLPTPETAFYKMTGLNKFFPNSKKINRYYLGHLSNEENHEIEVLSGAFMFMRKSALDKVGLLDEQFFMYGEDIDLSYRIVKGGYKNFYLAETSIIHYKGESTKKGSLNYVFVFYNAMVIFAKKHFSSQNASIYSRLIQVAIWLRAAWTLIVRGIKKFLLPVVDVAFLFLLLSFALQCYGKWKQIDYQEDLITKGLVAASTIYIIVNLIVKGYAKPWNYRRWFTAALIGSVSTLTLYSLLPDTLRFSRAIFLFSPVVFLVYILLTRFSLNKLSSTRFPFRRDQKIKFGILGNQAEYDRVKELISQTKSADSEYIHFNIEEDKRYRQLDEIISVYGLDEVVFCAANLSSSDIIRLMSKSESKKVDFKIAPPESLYIIGSNSVDKKGDLFILDVNSISKDENKRKKRVFDVIASLVFLLFSPVLVWFTKSPRNFMKGIFSVLRSHKTWVGYTPGLETNLDLPKLKQGLVQISSSKTSPEVKTKLNVLYARDYKLRNDLSLVLKSWTNVG